MVRDPPTAHVDPYTHAPVAASALCAVASPSAPCIGQAAYGDRAGAFCPRPDAPKGAPALAKRGVGRPPSGPTSLLLCTQQSDLTHQSQAGRWASDRYPYGTSPGRRAAAAGWAQPCQPAAARPGLGRPAGKLDDRARCCDAAAKRRGPAGPKTCTKPGHSSRTSVVVAVVGVRKVRVVVHQRRVAVGVAVQLARGIAGMVAVLVVGVVQVQVIVL